IEKIYQTVHGTIFSNIIDEDLSDDYAIAVKDMALEKSRALAGWYNLGKAENWDDFVDCMRLIDTPQLNIAYSDLEDNIGYWCTGKIPIRKEGNGKVPVPGWTGEHDWDGVIPFEEMPHLLNPEQGYIITTNNRIVDSDFPHYLGEIWMNGYRARRLEDLILETIKERKITQKDLNDFMMDDYCIPGVEFQAHFMDLDLSDFNDREAKILEIFATWDGRMDTESVGASLYEVSKYFTFKQIFETKLGKKLTENMMGIGFHPVLLSANVFFGRDTVALLRLLNTNSEWLEDSKENILKASFKLAIEWLEDNLGKGYSNWKWGSIHQASFPHAFDITPPMDRIFNVKPIPIRGNTDTPFQTAMNADDVFNNNAWSPSYRVSFDLRDLTKTEGIICPGQSGTLGSKHYDDLVERWSNGELLHYYIDPKDRRDKFDAKLILSPK
ncbi:MAG: penicillin acylase family protein, partial [Candidatus Heimdallarchaeota archaeon]|nr:penicillin acylase family protein [Candidatus Heimdallarchaeota archaeon]MCK5048325.1 penicillin acylase family protein [Candidatus Heimdallarchaeota archaeon]